MQGQGVVVTGGANGLGRALALRLAAAGAALAIVEIDRAGAEAVAERIRGEGGRAAVIIGDITRRAPAQQIFAEAAAALGRVHGLANVAGVYPRRPLLEISDEDWEASFAVNLRGLYHMSVAATHHMRRAGGGRIVNIASIDAFVAHPKNAHYAAMKAAVVSLTKSFGLELAPSGVLVNGVAPGPIATDKAKAAGWLPEVAKATPIGHAAEPEDIADVVMFLLSEQNRYLVGETVVASGGYVIP